jgi:hypothetical protein
LFRRQKLTLSCSAERKEGSDKMDDELEGFWKEMVMAWCGILSCRLTGNTEEGTRKTSFWIASPLVEIDLRVREGVLSIWLWYSVALWRFQLSSKRAAGKLLFLFGPHPTSFCLKDHHLIPWFMWFVIL